MRNSSPVSAGFGALAAICTILVAIIVSSFATLIRNYKKRRKYALENQRQNDGRPPIKVQFSFVSHPILLYVEEFSFPSKEVQNSWSF